MIINHNMPSMNANRQMGINATNAGKSMEKLSSGLRINKAGDDAAGLAISEKMRGQIRGLDQASANSQDAIALIQTGEGALSETHSILQRMRELAVQSASDTNIGTDREQIQGEMDQLATEISRISNTTEFNQKNLLGGNLNDTYQVGANKGQNINLKVKSMDALSLGVAGTATTATSTDTAKITSVDLDRSKGTALVNGASVDVTREETTGDATEFTHATALAGATGLTKIAAGTDGSQYNDYTVVVNKSLANGAPVTANIDNGAKTITLNFSADLLGTSTAAGINTALDLATGSTGALVATGNVTAIATPGTATATTKGYDGANEDRVTVTVGGSSEQIIVGKDAAAASTSSTDAALKGLTMNFADGNAFTVVSGAITISDKASSTATFNTDGTIKNDAVAAAGIDVSSQTAANSAIKTINDAIETVSTERSKLGAYQNRLEHTIANLGTSSENLTSAESRIRDVDMAKEMSTFSKNNILSQAAQAMLAQANQQPQQVLQLLR
jgi:flagellin